MKSSWSATPIAATRSPSSPADTAADQSRFVAVLGVVAALAVERSEVEEPVRGRHRQQRARTERVQPASGSGQVAVEERAATPPPPRFVGGAQTERFPVGQVDPAVGRRHPGQHGQVGIERQLVALDLLAGEQVGEHHVLDHRVRSTRSSPTSTRGPSPAAISVSSCRTPSEDGGPAEPSPSSSRTLSATSPTGATP